MRENEPKTSCVTPPRKRVPKNGNCNALPADLMQAHGGDFAPAALPGWVRKRAIRERGQGAAGWRVGIYAYSCLRSR